MLLATLFGSCGLIVLSSVMKGETAPTLSFLMHWHSSSIRLAGKNVFWSIKRVHFECFGINFAILLSMDALSFPCVSLTT